MQIWKTGFGIAVLVGVLCGAAGCDPEAPPSPPASGQGLAGRTFLLQSSEGFQPVAGTKIYLTFSTTRLGFDAGCNDYSGPYRLDNGELVLSGFENTLIGCDTPRHQQEDWLAKFLTSRPRLTLQGNDLTLGGTSATLVFLDREIADPDRPLVGTLWTVALYLTESAASGLFMTKDPTFVFGSDGHVQVDTTCNAGSGAFQFDGVQLSLNSMQYTDKVCEGAQTMVDQHMRALVSDGPLSVEITAARLVLKRGNLGVHAYAPQ